MLPARGEQALALSMTEHHRPNPRSPLSLERERGQGVREFGRSRRSVFRILARGRNGR